MIGRRRLLSLAGSAAFGVGSGIVGARLTGEHASIRFIGNRSSMIALLDTGTERALFVLGDQNDALTGNIANLLTVGNGRIDLVVATHRVLATRAAREHLGIEHTATICLQSDMSLPSIRGKLTRSSQNTDIAMGEAGRVSIQPQGSGSVAANSDHPEFIVDIGINGVRLLLGSSVAALRRSHSGRADLLAVPEVPNDLMISQVEPSLVVSGDAVTESNTAHLQVFWNDPVIVRIGEGALEFRRNQLSS